MAQELIETAKREGEIEKAFAGLCYRKPFLNRAVLKIDFAVPNEGVAKGLLPAVAKAALKYFPISEPRKQIAEQLQISGTGFKKSRSESTLWTYHGNEREKTLEITPTHFAVNRTRYSTYEEFKEEFFEPLTAFLDSYPDTVISRFGIRYINEIKFKAEASPTDWHGYLNPKLLGLFDFAPDHSVLSRVFNIMEMNYGDLRLKFQFGMNNADFPATIREKSFILDLDAFRAGLLDRADVVANVDRAHEKIQELFELSITEKVRDEMT
jgi:uncharacterized protein (TIGR04255 family)